MFKSTKIVATIGPASEKQSTLQAMMAAGMNVCRLNFSHGTYEHHAMLIRNIRNAAKRQGVHVGILADLQGPRIRLGDLPKDGIEILPNTHIVFSTRARPPKGAIPVTYENLHKDVGGGDRLLIADGVMEVVVEKVRGQEIAARVMQGGVLKSHKGINVPTATLHIPPITAKDKSDVAFALSKGVDFIALSFVMDAANVRALRAIIRAQAKKLKKPDVAATPIIVKIEKHEAVKNFDAILAEADGVMIARGDLALEVDQAQVPSIQKMIIEKCRTIAKPVVVATQMLESMMEHHRPTRAEISDVGHAVMDHTDATMLSGESAMGKFPVETIKTMANIIRETEQSKWDDITPTYSDLLLRSREQGSFDKLRITKGNREQSGDDSDYSQCSWMGAVARLLVDESNPRYLVVASATGRTARAVASFRPSVPMIAAVPSEHIAQRIVLSWGVTPVVVGKARDASSMLATVERELVKKKALKKGDSIVYVASDPLREEEPPNTIALKKVLASL